MRTSGVPEVLLDKGPAPVNAIGEKIGLTSGWIAAARSSHGAGCAGARGGRAAQVVALVKKLGLEAQR
jgi:hypothetical protein